MLPADPSVYRGKPQHRPAEPRETDPPPPSQRDRYKALFDGSPIPTPAPRGTRL